MYYDEKMDYVPDSPPRTKKLTISGLKISTSLTGINISESSSSSHAKCTGIPQRYIFIMLGFFGFFNLYAMRVNLSVALVAMVKDPLLSDNIASAQSSVACLELVQDVRHDNNSVHYISPATRGGFDWDSNMQHLVLGSFYYGYFLTQIPGGILAEKYSAKILYGMGMLVTAIFTLLTPLAASWSVWALMAARMIEGLGEGVTYPAMNVLIGRWAPEMERSSTSTMISIGTTIGTVVSLIVSGQLCDSTFFGGWPSAFYVFGSLGCLGFVLWMSFVYESPELHPRITKSELLRIQNGQEKRVFEKVPIPWKAIMTSAPMWGLIITHFGQNWGFYTLLTETPLYLSNVLHFNLKENGILSALPNFIQLVVAILVSLTVDKLHSSGCIRITVLRKIVNSAGLYIPAICMILVTFVGCQPYVIVILFSLAMGINGCIYSGFNVTHIDMSPELAGTLMGITNCIANLPGFLAPSFVGWIIQSGNTLQNWGIVYITAAVVLIICGTVYNMLCKAVLQPWSPSYEAHKGIEVLTDNAEK